MLRAREYDEAPDGGFAVELEDGAYLWVAHHQINGTWKVTNYQRENAYLFLSASAVSQLITVAAETEERSGFRIAYRTASSEDVEGTQGT